MTSFRATPAVLSAGGAAILGELLWRLGSAPFVQGLHAVDARAAIAAAGLGALATVACAWRWQLVARRLGVTLELPTAISAYYRSQWLNTVLPGGVLGDVHRGVQHGRSTGDVGLGLRAVAWERLAGQTVQVAIVASALLLFPSPVRRVLPIGVGLAAAAAAAALLLHRSGHARWVRRTGTDLRRVLLQRSAWPGVVASSAVVVAAHATTFGIAATAAGTEASWNRLVPLALLNLLAMSIPISLAGWGPREGAAAWSFAASGHSAAQGVAVGTTYGVLVFVATLPGLLVVLTGWTRGRGSTPLARAAAHG